MARHLWLIWATIVIIALASCGAAGKIDGVHLDKIQLPPGNQF
jgi:hypothetical protein